MQVYGYVYSVWHRIKRLGCSQHRLLSGIFILIKTYLYTFDKETEQHIHRSDLLPDTETATFNIFSTQTSFTYKKAHACCYSKHHELQYNGT